VGKHMDAYPERYSPGISELIRSRLLGSLSKSTGSTRPKKGENEPEGGEEKFDLTFFDILGGKKGATPSEISAGAEKEQPPVTSAASAGPTESPAMPGASTSTSVRPTGKTAADTPAGEGIGKKNSLAESGPAAETAAKKSVTSPAERPPEDAASKKGRYEIQAGAYRERKKAEQMVQKISAPGFPARVVMKELAGRGTWYRVIVGGFENRAKAQEAADKLVAKVGGLKCVIRPSERNEIGE
jgi:cell division protein FtsN